MIEAFAEEWAVFPQRYAGHLWLSLSAILTGILVSVPVGIIAARSKTLSGPALGFASLVQTIPGLALLALMVPLLGGRIGFWPAYIALALYSMLPILRNAIVGLQGVPENVREAALGVGMTPAQRLWKVDLPIAAPVMVAGLRTASVWVVGAATLSTPVGAESLGNYIFSGLQIRDWGMVLFGCIVSATLAIALDQTIRLFEIAAEKGDRVRAFTGALAFAVILVPAFSHGLAQQRAYSGHGILDVPVEQAVSLDGQTIRVMAKPFTEQYILAELIKMRLEEQGARVLIRDNLGSSVAFDALANNEIDVGIDYSGTVWANVLKRDAPVSRDRMVAETSAYLWNEFGMVAFGRLGFENAYAFAMRRDRAEELGISTIADLSGRSDLVKGGDVEFFARPEWIRARDTYGLQALKTRGMDSTFMYSAVRDKEVDAITAYTTDGRIDVFDLMLLKDPAGALPPYDAYILLAPDMADNRPLHDALRPLINAISADVMRAANGRVDLEGQSAIEAAEWLAKELGWGDEKVTDTPPGSP